MPQVLTLPETRAALRAERPRIGPERKLKKSHILGYDLASTARAEMVYWIADRAQSRTPTQIAFLNAHCDNLARKDWKYRDTLRSVDALLPDGSGVALAAKLEGRELGENLNGTDLFDPLCRCLAFRKIPIFFLGGRPQVAEQVAQTSQAKFPGLNVAGFHHGYFAPREEDAVLEAINRSGARVVFVAFGVPDQDVWISRVKNRLNAPVIMGVGGLFDFVSERIPRAPVWMRRIGMEWIYRLKCEPKRMWRRYLVGNVGFMFNAVRYALGQRSRSIKRHMHDCLKRCVDILGAVGGITLLSPILLVIALRIKLESPGPAIFRQVRVGKNGSTFVLFKFRSMCASSDDEAFKKLAADNDRDDGVTFKLKNDPRVTRFGAFIRKYSMDELPQLWNVLRGDMSLVGPRPALPQEVQKYTPAERRRLGGKPGLTCTWQITGRADISFDQQVRLDVAYLRKPSIWRDVMILLKTPLAVLTAKGAY